MFMPFYEGELRQQKIDALYKSISYFSVLKYKHLQLTHDFMSQDKKRQTHLIQQKQTQKTQKLKLTDILLTNDQKLIIMSKLPKLFSLQSVKNLPKRQKNDVIDTTKNKNKQVGVQDLLKSPSRILYKKQRYLIEQNQNEEVKIGLRKSQLTFLRDQKKLYEDEDILSQYQNIHQTNNSQILPTEIDFSKNPHGQNIEDTLEIDIKEFKRKFSSMFSNQKQLQGINNHAHIKKENLMDKMKVQQKEEKPIQNQTQPAQLTFQKQWYILNSLKRHSMIKPFLLPVDEFLDKAKDYYKYIKNPMDLNTIQSKLNKKLYKEPSQFHKDIEQIWINSLSYNKPSSGMAKITKELKRFYFNLIKTNQSESISTQKHNKKRRR